MLPLHGGDPGPQPHGLCGALVSSREPGGWAPSSSGWSIKTPRKTELQEAAWRGAGAGVPLHPSDSLSTNSWKGRGFASSPVAFTARVLL